MTTQAERVERMLATTGLGWADIRAVTGVTRAGLKKWRDGDFKKLTATNLFALADLFGCDPRWLAFGDGEPFFARDNAFREIGRLWALLNTEGRKSMLEHARYIAAQARFLGGVSTTSAAAGA